MGGGFRGAVLRRLRRRDALRRDAVVRPDAFFQHSPILWRLRLGHGLRQPRCRRGDAWRPAQLRQRAPVLTTPREAGRSTTGRRGRRPGAGRRRGGPRRLRRRGDDGGRPELRRRRPRRRGRRAGRQRRGGPVEHRRVSGPRGTAVAGSEGLRRGRHRRSRGRAGILRGLGLPALRLQRLRRLSRRLGARLLERTRLPGLGLAQSVLGRLGARDGAWHGPGLGPLLVGLRLVPLRDGLHALQQPVL